MRTLFKRLLQFTVAIVSCLAALAAYVWFTVATYTGTCRHSTSGYEGGAWYENGRRDDAASRFGSDYFPPLEQQSRFEAAGIKYENYDRFVACGEDSKFSERVNIVRFSVAPEFQFRPSPKYTDAGQVPGHWYDEPPGDYVPVGAHERQAKYAGDALAQSWLAPPKSDVVNELPGRKEFIDSLHRAWLEEEPLDAAHLMGIWQKGWLFRSAKTGYYVWID